MGPSERYILVFFGSAWLYTRLFADLFSAIHFVAAQNAGGNFFSFALLKMGGIEVCITLITMCGCLRYS